MTTDLESLYLQLKALVSNIPDLDNRLITHETRTWLSRATVIVEKTAPEDYISLSVACDHLGGNLHDLNVKKILSIIYRSLARAELAAPVSVHGSFIPVDKPFIAINVINDLFKATNHSLLIIDPYADANLLFEFCVLAPEKIIIQILADEKHHKPGLNPAAKKWQLEYSTSRPIDVRVAPTKTLHDRIIIKDESEAWVLGQSFNGLAKRAPTFLQKVDKDATEMKIAAYLQIWNKSKRLI